MIKINLLPVRAAKKKETLQQQLSIAGLSVAGVLIIAGVIYSVTLTKISTTKDEISRSETELQTLKKKIGEIDNLKKLQTEVKKKLDILNHLRKEKTGPATRLARISDIVPEKMWLTKYAENGASVSISGIAFSEELIAEFMRSLQASAEFGNVELQVSEQTDIGGIKAKKFDLSCTIKTLKKEEPPQKK
jgi:type IV pilus assembly protein PilN